MHAPEAAALLAPGRPPLTYRRLHELALEATAALNQAGIGRNDRVAIVLPNGPEMAAAFLATACACTAAPLNPAYQASEFEFYLTDLRAKALVAAGGSAPAARQAAQNCGVPVIVLNVEDAAEAGYFTLTAPSDGTCDRPGPAGADDVALVLHTSGTTSRPKIVPLTQANVCATANNIRQTLRLTADDVCLNVMPLFHIHGLMAAVLGSLAAGAGVVCTPGFDAQRFFQWLETFQPTWYTAVPTIHQAVLEQAQRNRGNGVARSLRLIRSSSSSLAPAVMQALEETFEVPVIEAYGMTEAAHQMCSNPLPPGIRKPGSVGPAAGPEVAIMNEQGKLLGPDETGEVVIRGRNVTAGYENNPAANEAAFTSGWFRTGDQGRIDADGYLTLTGRLKEIINRGGEKISPREIDEVLLTHPAVAQAVCFAVPHPSLGEDLAAAVVLRPDQAPTEQDLRQFAFARLADFKVPSRIVFVNAIPKGPSGKLQRIGLYQHLAEALQPPYAAPETAAEDVLSDIWRELLPVERVGRNDNFFSLGGDSLLAARLVARIRAALEIDLPLETVFRLPALSELALSVEERLMQDIEAGTQREADPA